MQRVIEGTINAFVTPYDHVGPEDLKRMTDAELVRSISYTASAMSSTDWTRVGTVRVEVTLDAEAEIVNNAITALRAEQTKVRAEAERKATDIERRIQTLLAITNEVAA